jgi:hypothetical protein
MLLLLRSEASSAPRDFVKMINKLSRSHGVEEPREARDRGNDHEAAAPNNAPCLCECPQTVLSHGKVVERTHREHHVYALIRLTKLSGVPSSAEK